MSNRLIDTSKVGTRYQVTITERVRKNLQIEPGDLMAFYEKDGEIVIKKA